MTYPPGQSFTFQDGGIGLAVALSTFPLVVGCSSTGTPTELYQFANSVDVLSDLGEGPGVELAAVLADLGGCLYLEATDGVAGAAGAVTPTRVGTSTGTITTAGTPTNKFNVAVEIMATGTVGTGRFRYRIDYDAAVQAQGVLGSGWSPEIGIPAGGSYVLGSTGITLTFVPGAGAVYFEDGDLHTFDCTAPHYTTANLATAYAALDDQLGNLYFDQVFFTGVNATGADAATMGAAVATIMDDLEQKHYFCRALMDAGSADTAANVKSGLAAFAESRVGVCYGYCHLATKVPATGWGAPKLSCMNVFAERAVVADLSENLGRKMRGALRGVSAIAHDEDRERAFIESDKINTLRTYRGEAGFYATNGYLKSSMGSDYLYYDWGHTMDRAARVIYLAQNPWLLAKLMAKTDGTGVLTEASASRVERAVRGQLKNVLLDPVNVEGDKGHVSGCSYTVDRTNDFLGTRIVRSTFAAVPLSPIENFASTVGFARSL